jgi:hypothetical protein
VVQRNEKRPFAKGHFVLSAGPSRKRPEMGWLGELNKLATLILNVVVQRNEKRPFAKGRFVLPAEPGCKRLEMGWLVS